MYTAVLACLEPQYAASAVRAAFRCAMQEHSLPAAAPEALQPARIFFMDLWDCEATGSFEEAGDFSARRQTRNGSRIVSREVLSCGHEDFVIPVEGDGGECIEVVAGGAEDAEDGSFS